MGGQPFRGVDKALGQMIELLGAQLQMVAGLSMQGIVVCGQTPPEHRAFRRGQFGGRGWRRRAAIGGKIGERDVGLVPDAGDDGNRTVANGTGQGFVVECPEVFQAASSSAEDQGVTFKSFAGPINGRGDLGRGRVALNQRGLAPDAALWRTTRPRCQYVPSRRAQRR